MNLTKVYFDAYRSLQDQELEIIDDCIGLVGINESGKSNILQALNILSEDSVLTFSDLPKNLRGTDCSPRLRFEFKLTSEEKEEIQGYVEEWGNDNCLTSDILKSLDFRVVLNVEYDVGKEDSSRFFVIEGLEVKDHLMILSPEIENDLSNIYFDGELTDVSDAIVIPRKALIENTKREELRAEHKSICAKLDNWNKLSKASENSISNDNGTTEDELDDPEMSEESTATIDGLSQRKKVLEGYLKILDLQKLQVEKKALLKKRKQQLTELKAQLRALRSKRAELEAIKPRVETQENELIVTQKNLALTESRIEKAPTELSKIEAQIQLLGIPLVDKYSNDPVGLSTRLAYYLADCFEELIPRVVYWRYSENFILSAETSLSSLLAVKSLSKIPRPLVNIFRIGLEINSLSDLKGKLKAIQSDSDMRNKLNDRLNNRVNEYIQSVWQDYDQEIKISLERDQIVIQFYDPEHEDRNYYSMGERSQGAQTFLSFMLTVGAESNKSVIKNTILLLDEPETHLHPRGVRYLLEELHKISERNNLVVYATHSVFMINRENYSKYIIIKKHKENTNIIPSQIGRIGYFMQEEVLFSIFDSELQDIVPSSKMFNFVFEGEGDAVLFERYYTLKDKKASADASFYHGGGCSRIQNFLKRRPFQLGTKWIFFLDYDDPAHGLKAMLDGKYKEYIGKDIFVFQVKNKEFESERYELEDVLPVGFLQEEINKIVEKFGIEVTQAEISAQLEDRKSFSSIVSFLKGRCTTDFTPVKTEFKNILNQDIKEKANQLTSLSKFKQYFPEFTEIAESVISEISVSTPEKGKKSSD